MSSSSKRNNPLVFIIIALILIGVSWWGIRALSMAKPAGQDSQTGGSGGPPPANVVLAPVKKAMSQKTQHVVGTLRARKRSKIAARESGAVLELLVNEGDRVEADAVIARLDPRRLDAQIAEAQADLTVAKAMLTQRQAEVDRAKSDLAMKDRLFKQNALSQSEALDAQREFSVAEAQSTAANDSLSASQARLDLMQVRIADADIRAPFAGQVVSLHSEIGEWLTPGDPVVTLVSTGDIEAWLQVPERHANAVQGKEIPITLSAIGQVIKSKKLTLVADADTSTRTLQVIALLPNEDGQLTPGLSVSAQLPVTEKSERLSVPVNAIAQSYAGPGVFVATPQKGSPLPVARRVEVEILYQENGIAYLISDELKENDQVVTEGNERLFPFQPLLVQEPQK